MPAAQHDPWARLEQWRSTPGITRHANIRKMLPGLAIGTGAFVVAVVVEALVAKKK
eukprot:m.321139 g.321139  ORF g.321139 m.321139 type:complete len:56 (-) comp24996_c0_seq1:36-203(-)